MNHLLLKKQLDNEKDRQIRGKIIKSSMTFNENKPNFNNIKIGVSSCKTGKYEILTVWRGKKQTQYKANSSPIKPNFGPISRVSKAKQSQFKPKVDNNQSSLIDNQLRRQTQFVFFSKLVPAKLVPGVCFLAFLSGGQSVFYRIAGA